MIKHVINIKGNIANNIRFSFLLFIKFIAIYPFLHTPIKLVLSSHYHDMIDHVLKFCKIKYSHRVYYISLNGKRKVDLQYIKISNNQWLLLILNLFLVMLYCFYNEHHRSTHFILHTRNMINCILCWRWFYNTL